MLLFENITLPILEGFGLGASLIIAIGAQNAFVLKQGLKKQHLLLTATLCVFFDIILISLGVSGLSLIISNRPLLLVALRIAGAAFLILYGLRSLWELRQPHALIAQMDGKQQSIKQTILALMAFTFLNPHTYIDTMLLIGSVGAQYNTLEQPFFILGVLIASAVWFYGIVYAASLLAPYFKKPGTWYFINILMAVIMFGIALTLLL